MADTQPVKEKIVYVERKRSGCLVPILIFVAIAGIGGGIYYATNPNQLNRVVGSTSVKIGEPVTVGSWKVTAEKTDVASELVWSEFGNKETATGKYLKVYLTAENIAGKTDSINSFDYKLLDSQGAKYDVCANYACHSIAEMEKRKDIFFGSIPARTKIDGLVVFDVAKDAKGFTLDIENGKAKIALDK